MFKKSDILPLTLAFVSTLLLVGMGFLWLTKSNLMKSTVAKNVNQDGSLNLADVEPKDSNSSVSISANPDISKQAFTTPDIVPQGTSVNINGSSKVIQVNRVLRKNFHRKFPGTVVNIDADGNEVGINLLASGDIDLAATDRPLNEAEKASGLVEMKINHSSAEDKVNQDLYYVYREPANSAVETFLGYALSSEGQQVITKH